MIEELADQQGQRGEAAGGDSRGVGPGRRRTRLAVLAVLGLVAVAAAGTWIYVERSGILAARALSYANRLLARSSNLRLSARGLERTATGVRLLEPLLEVREGRRWYPGLRSRRAELGVDLAALALGRGQIFRVRLEEPSFLLFYTNEGKAVLPVFRSSGKAKPRRDGLRLELARARFAVRGPADSTEWWTRGALVASLVPEREGYGIKLARLRGSLPPLGLVLAEGRGRGWAGGDRFEWSELAIRTDAGRLSARGGVQGPNLGVDFEAEGWPWEFLGDLLEQPALDVGGSVAVRGRVAGTLASPSFRVRAEGRWREEAFAGALAGGLGPRGVEVARARIEWREASLEGSARFGKEGRWWLEGRLAGLDLSGVDALWPGVALPATRLAGRARVEGGAGRLSLAATGLGGDVRGVAIEDVAGSWTIDGRAQRFDATGRVAGGSVAVSGARQADLIEVTAWSDGVDLGAVFRGGDGWPEVAGTARDATLRLAGPLARPRVEARARIDSPAHGGARAAWLEASVAGWLGKTGQIELSVTALNLEAGAMRADSAVARGTYGEGDLRLSEIRLARAETSLGLSLTARAGAGAWRVLVPQARFEAGEWWLATEGPLAATVGAGELRIETARVAGNLGRGELAGVVRDGGSADLHVALAEVNLAALGPLVGARGLSGSLWLDAHLQGGAGWRKLDVSFRSPEILAPPTRVHGLQGSAALRLGEDVLEVTRLRIAAGAGTLEASGQARLRDSIAFLDPASWRQALRGAREWRGDLRAANFDLALLAALWPEARGLGGRCTGSAHLGGVPAHPEGETRGAVAGLTYAGYRLEAAEWLASYGSGALTLDHLAVTGGGLTSRITGTVPLDLAWDTPFERRVPERPMDVRLHVPEGDLGMLPVFLPLVAAADGRVGADVRITGSPKQPRASGTARIRDGTVRFAGREEVYHAVAADLRLENDHIVVETVSARQGESGRLEGKGELRLAGARIGTYRLFVSARRAMALASGEYSLEFDGDFEVAAGPRMGDAFFPIPHVAGRLGVLEGVLLYDFADPENRVYFVGPRRDPAWIYDVEVDAPGRVYWRTPNANIEMKAKLTASQTLDGLRVWGTVESLRGDYYFLENKFRVESGLLSFDEVEPLNPKVEAKAKTIINRAAGGKTIEREEVAIELAGRLRKPEVKLHSTSGLPETDLIRLLTVGRFGLDLRGGDPMAQEDRRILVGTMGGQYLVRQLAREFPEASDLLREVEVGTEVVNGDAGGRLVPRLGVSQYLTGDLRLRYSQLLGGSQAGGLSVDFRDVGAEYRISRVFYLTGEVVERRRGSLFAPGASRSDLEYNVDLRARHEW